MRCKDGSAAAARIHRRAQRSRRRSPVVCPLDRFAGPLHGLEQHHALDRPEHLDQPAVDIVRRLLALRRRHALLRDARSQCAEHGREIIGIAAVTRCTRLSAAELRGDLAHLGDLLHHCPGGVGDARRKQLERDQQQNCARRNVPCRQLDLGLAGIDRLADPFDETRHDQRHGEADGKCPSFHPGVSSLVMRATVRKTAMPLMIPITRRRPSRCRPCRRPTGRSSNRAIGRSERKMACGNRHSRKAGKRGREAS